MIHRLTLPNVVLRDYESRKVFPRYRFNRQYPNEDLSVKVSSEELAELLTDAERRAGMDRLTTGYYPNLKREFSHFAEKLRRIVRTEPGDETRGRIGKDAASGD